MDTRSERNVFISYSNKDSRYASGIHKLLVEAGMTVFLDYHSSLPGEDYQSAILKAVEASRVVVLVLSSNSAASPSVEREVELAIARGIPVIPFWIEDAQLSGRLEYLIGRIQPIEATTPPLEPHLRLLTDTVKRLIDRTPSPPPKRGGPAPAKSRPSAIWNATSAALQWLVPSLGLTEEPTEADDEQLATILDAMEVRTLGQVAEFGDRTLPTTIRDPTIARALGHFVNASMSVGQYLAVEEPSLRRDALDNALKELARVQDLLGQSRRPLDDSFLDIAKDWRKLIRPERVRVDAEARASQALPNPFVFGNPVTELNSNLFTGRRDIVQQIEQGILNTIQAPTMLLHGQRRMGKTSILNQLPRLLGPGFLPVTVDCQVAASGSPTVFFRYLGRALSNSLNRRLPRTQAGGGPADFQAPELADLAVDPFLVFDEWLDGVQAALPGNLKILLCLDEFERLGEAIRGGWGLRLLDLVRHWYQFRPYLVLMLAGSHTFEELGPDWTDRFISARRVKVSYLKSDEVRSLLTRPVPDFGLAYAPGTLDALFEATRGQPFLTQAVASELVQHLNLTRRKEATLDDVEAAVGRALDSGGEYFANIWSGIPDGGKATLRDLARGLPPSGDAATLDWLREHDLIGPEGGIVVPMIRRWVSERRAG